MTRAFIQVEFRLRSLPPSIQDEMEDDKSLKLGIVGSIPELGSWQSRKLLKAVPCLTEDNAWTVTSRLPMSATFKWTWRVTTRTGQILYSDTAGPKRTTLSIFSGTMDTRWGDTETCFTSDTSAVSMSVDYNCQDGELMAVVGSEACLGSWDPQRAIRAINTPAQPLQWTAHTLLDNTIARYQWKWLVLDLDTGSVKFSETGNSRHLSLPDHRMQMINTIWNIKEDDIVTMRSADRTSWWTYLMKLAALLPFIYDWYRV